MKCVLSDVLAKRKLSVNVGKIARDVLLANKFTPDRRNNAMIQISKEAYESDSITDRWLKRALSKKRDMFSQQGVGLHLPIVLKTLQKLRSSDNETSYFTLLNKIKSSDVVWISENGKHTTGRENMPIEFYHEVSNMIYRMSLLKTNFTDLHALADFTMGLMDSYQQFVSQTIVSFKQYQVKFYKNCLMVLVKSESLLSLSAVFERIPPNQNGIKILAALAFYHQTGQFTKVLDILEGSVLTQSKDCLITKTQIKTFFPVLFNVLQECLINGEEELCNKLLHKLHSDWGYEIDDHYFTVLRELSERFAMDEVSLTLASFRHNIAVERLKEKIIQRRMSWPEYYDFLRRDGINMFEKELHFDFSQVILSSVGPTLQNWKTFIEQNNALHGANESLKAYFINSIFINLAAQKKVGFMLALLEHFIYDLQLSKSFVDSHQLVGMENCSGFHALFKSISNSSSSTLTAYSLFGFLQQSSEIGFHFNTNDFYCLMKACTYSLDHHHAIYFFLFQYFKLHGHTLYDKSEENHKWELPACIEQLLEMTFNSTGDHRMREIVSNARDLFIGKKLQNGEPFQADEDSLKEIFGDEYLPTINVSTLSFAKDEQCGLEDLLKGTSSYVSSVDLENSQRLSNCLAYIVTHSSPKKK